MLSYETHDHIYKVWHTNDTVFPPHLHQEIEILYVLDGSLKINIDHIPYTVPAKHYVLIMPNTLHSHPFPSPEEHFTVIFSPTLVPYYKSLLSKKCSSPIISSSIISPDSLHAFEQLLKTYPLEDIGLLKGYLYLLFSSLVSKSTFSDETLSSTDTLICNALSYINENFNRPINAPILAKHLGINNCYISQLFNKHLGYSFSHYLNIVRIDYAKHLLEETNTTITDICFECGYNTVRNFNRIFKQFTSLTPKDYRKRLVSTNNLLNNTTT